MAVPVPSTERIVAVLEFFATEPRARDEAVADVIARVATQLGADARAQARRAGAAHERGTLPPAARERRGLRDRDARPRRQRGRAGTTWPSASPAIAEPDIIGCHVSRLYAPEALEQGEPEQHLRQAAADAPDRALGLVDARGRPALPRGRDHHGASQRRARAARLQLRDPRRDAAPPARRGAASGCA